MKKIAQPFYPRPGELELLKLKYAGVGKPVHSLVQILEDLRTKVGSNWMAMPVAMRVTSATSKSANPFLSRKLYRCRKDGDPSLHVEIDRSVMYVCMFVCMYYAYMSFPQMRHSTIMYICMLFKCMYIRVYV